MSCIELHDQRFCSKEEHAACDGASNTDEQEKLLAKLTWYFEWKELEIKHEYPPNSEIDDGIGTFDFSDSSTDETLEVFINEELLIIEHDEFIICFDFSDSSKSDKLDLISKEQEIFKFELDDCTICLDFSDSSNTDTLEVLMKEDEFAKLEQEDSSICFDFSDFSHCDKLEVLIKEDEFIRFEQDVFSICLDFSDSTNSDTLQLDNNFDFCWLQLRLIEDVPGNFELFSTSIDNRWDSIKEILWMKEEDCLEDIEP